MNKKLFILIALSVLLLGIFLFFRFSGSGTSALWSLSNGGTWLLPLVAVSALIDSINPCAFSILILTIAFLFSIGKLRSKILLIGGVYILGIFLVYLFIGLGILQTLHFFNTPHFMAKVGAFLLIAFGAVSLMSEFFPAFPIKLRIPHAAHQKMAELVEKGSIPTAFLLGGLVGLCEFPCTGGPYIMVLGLLHDQATYLKGLGYLILYNLIFVLPLALILSIGSNKALLDKVQSWQREKRILMRFGGGIAMIALGFAIFFL
ncbi:MAG: cytochrome c biogenesis protein CcdA [bacterium]|nr:cytochrome c biogenesis protein CcdA [bacterium]